MAARRTRLRELVAVGAAAASLLAAGCADGGPGDDEVVVMAASSLVDVVEAVEAHFERGGGPGVTLVAAGSSTVVAQLAAGAEADVLITADEATMLRASSAGIVAGEPAAIATNTLVLATAAGNPGGVAGLADLAREELLVGLCAAEVPCGALAGRALRSAGVSVAADTLEPNVRALAAKISLGELDAGLVYATDAAAAGLATVESAALHGHVNRYLLASVSAEPAAAVRAVMSAFTAPDGPGAEALRAAGFGPP